VQNVIKRRRGNKKAQWRENVRMVSKKRFLGGKKNDSTADGREEVRKACGESHTQVRTQRGTWRSVVGERVVKMSRYNSKIGWKTRKERKRKQTLWVRHSTKKKMTSKNQKRWQLFC